MLRFRNASILIRSRDASRRECVSFATLSFTSYVVPKLRRSKKQWDSDAFVTRHCATAKWQCLSSLGKMGLWTQLFCWWQYVSACMPTLANFLHVDICKLRTRHFDKKVSAHHRFEVRRWNVTCFQSFFTFKRKESDYGHNWPQKAKVSSEIFWQAMANIFFSVCFLSWWL